MKKDVTVVKSMLMGALISLLLILSIATPVSATWYYYYAGGWWDNEENWNVCGIYADIQLHAGHIGFGWPKLPHIASWVCVEFPETEHGRNWIEIGWVKRGTLFPKIKLFVGWSEDGMYDEDIIQKLQQDSTHRYEIAGSPYLDEWWVRFDYTTIKWFY